MRKFERWRLVYLLHFLPVVVAVVAIHAQTSKPHPAIPVLDCRESWVQSGVRVRRLTDQRVTRIDVCGAADSADDSFRDIPYEAPK